MKPSEELLQNRKALTSIISALHALSESNQDIVISGPSLLSGLILGLMQRDSKLVANLLTSATALGITIEDIVFLLTSSPNEDDTRLWNIILKFKPLA